MKAFFLIIAFYLVFPQLCHADQEAPNATYIKYSPNKKFMIEMVPSSSYGEQGTGKVYLASDTAKSHPIWEINWYAFNVFLSDDGEHLVRFGPWASDINNYSDLAIAFYRKGKLQKKYKVNNLVKDLSKVDHSVSHYTWTAEVTTVKTGFSNDHKTYTLVTSDKLVYEFDVKTGKILKKYLDPAAKNFIEKRKEESDAVEKQGLKIKSMTPELIEFDKYFNCERTEGLYGGGEFEGMWRTDLIPKEKQLYPWRCTVRFTIPEDKKVQVKLKPEDILELYRDFTSSRFAKTFLDSLNIIEIRFRTKSDRLNSLGEETEEYATMLSNNGYKVSDTKEWIEAIIDFKGKNGINRMISFLHPKGSDYYLLDYLDEELSSLESLLNRDNSLYDFYCYRNLTIFDKDGKMELISRNKY
ncbi:MAG: hypothetical protein HF300_00790 [Ignavibacteria bacterium]|jgi:hypothetical protein|nr:hypothetical protein [Ignavibacteria bacterium]MCU7511061.1 hypothetical protein [Ignavibacteria bacterium]MCU7525907.1 hypothetical protein [Ignavibacteria bacterium]